MYLGIDVGTSSVKTAVLDEAGALLASSSAPLAVSRPQLLWSEQNPQDWWQATTDAVLQLAPDTRRAVRAIGLSGQMHGATVLDAQDRVLRPAILWNDGRSGEQCTELEAAVPDLASITGNRAMAGFTAPKLLWLRAHEPQLFAQIATVLLPKDYVRLCMTGDKASDLSDSAGTLWLDVAQRSWSPTVLEATGLTLAHMPRLFEGNACTGHLRGEIAEAWGMRRVAVAAGGGDNAAGAIGAGVINPGDAFLSLGTSGVLFFADDRYRPNAREGVHTFCHALPGRWHQMAVILSAASCVQWAAELTGLDSAAALLALAEKRAQPAQTEIFLPYLSGERTPHNDPHAQGVFLGLTHATDTGALAQAVLEGVAFAFRDGLDALLNCGTRIESISVIGGGSRSLYWGRLLSTVLQRRLVYRDGAAVGPAFGAARLALLALQDQTVDSACTPPPVLEVVEPEAALAEHYAGRVEKYRGVYQALRASFRT